MAPITRNAARKAAENEPKRFFKAPCRTTEISHRLSVPVAMSGWLGKQTMPITIEVWHSGVLFRCLFEYREISGERHPMCRLTKGWGKVTDALGLNQGDIVEFEKCESDPTHFHVWVTRNPGIIKVDDEFWI